MSRGISSAILAMRETHLKVPKFLSSLRLRIKQNSTFQVLSSQEPKSTTWLLIPIKRLSDVRKVYLPPLYHGAAKQNTVCYSSVAIMEKTPF